MSPLTICNLHKTSKFVLTIFLYGVIHGIFGSLYINEFLASGSNSEDWVELYNCGDNDVDLENYYLTDNSSELTKWKFPTSVTIKSKEFLIIWLDDQDNVTGSELHTNFKLSKDGEEIILVDTDGTTVIDSITFPKQTKDISTGRFPDGCSDIFIFNQPTPNYSNSLDEKETSAPPIPSHNRGCYNSGFNLNFETEKNTTVYYTTDGSNPKIDMKMLFKKKISIDTSVTIKAIAVTDDYLPSDVVTHTYIINSLSSLPIVSVSTDPDNLWDNDKGIYALGPNADTTHYKYPGANFHKDWERDAKVEFINFDKNFSENHCYAVELKIAGASSRAMPKKSFSIKSKSNRFAIPFFEDRPIESFKSLTLRADAAGGHHLKNELIYKANISMGCPLDMQSYKPAVLYLNGQYWGIYNVMERKDKDFIKDNFDVKKADIISTNILTVKDGSLEDYTKMCDFLKNNDITDSAIYDSVNALIDIDNFINYTITDLYTGGTDIGWNLRIWKPTESTGKWRWICYDRDNWGPHRTDNIEQYLRNTDPGYCENDESLFFGYLIKNERFKKQFINSLTDHLNTAYSSDSLTAYHNAIYSVVHDELPRERTRWREEFEAHCNKFDNIKTDWFFHVNQEAQDNFSTYMKNGYKNRPQLLYKQIYTYLDADTVQTVRVTISGPEKAGTIQINNTLIQSATWSGKFFGGIPQQVTAIPNIGYKFVRWEGNVIKSNEQSISVVLDPENTSVKSIVAVFEKAETLPLIITEINYNEEEGDWIEIFNSSNTPMDITGWTISDAKKSTLIVEKTEIGPKEYMVFSNNRDSFEEKYGELENYGGDLNFGLNSFSDHIVIMDDQYKTVDSVAYTNKYPWPVILQNANKSIELKNTLSDNAIGIHWKASQEGSTPGKANSDTVAIITPNETKHKSRLIKSVFNTTQNSLDLSFNSPANINIDVTLIDLRGRIIAQFTQKDISSSRLSLPLKSISLGMYIVQVKGVENGTSKQLFNSTSKLCKY